MAARPPRRSRPCSDGRAAATAAALRRGHALPSRPAAPRLRRRRREGGPHLGAAPVRCRGSEAEPLLTGSSLSAPRGPAAMPHLGPRQRCSAADPLEYPPNRSPPLTPPQPQQPPPPSADANPPPLTGGCAAGCWGGVSPARANLLVSLIGGLT